MSAELHLPDLPEVAVSLGAPPGPPRERNRPGWRDRLRGLFGASLPLTLMVFLALGTWWLVKNAPQAPRATAQKPVRHEPDYRVESFKLERFDASGRLSVEMNGERLRHFPDTDEVEIDVLRLRATATDGKVTNATALQALVAGNGASAELKGGAKVTTTGPHGESVEFVGDHLLALIDEGRVIADQPVRVTAGASLFQAEALDYNKTTGLLVLRGPARVVFHPATSATAKAKK